MYLVHGVFEVMTNDSVTVRVANKNLENEICLLELWQHVRSEYIQNVQKTTMRCKEKSIHKFSNVGGLY